MKRRSRPAQETSNQTHAQLLYSRGRTIKIGFFSGRVTVMKRCLSVCLVIATLSVLRANAQSSDPPQASQTSATGEDRGEENSRHGHAHDKMPSKSGQDFPMPGTSTGADMHMQPMALLDAV